MSWAFRQAVQMGIEQGIEKGFEKGLAHERDIFRKMIRLRYPRSKRGLDDLLPRCSPEDLAWLGEALFTHERINELRQQLQARLSTSSS